ncbi:MAG: T9SS type A sorting domain-containing protein [Bacteroidales bacterium]
MKIIKKLHPLLVLIISFPLFSQPVTPVLEQSGDYSFTIANVQVVIDPSHGARIKSYSLDGQEFMHTEQDPGGVDMYGATCWISPQNLWNWPPQAAVDLNAYTGGILGDKLTLTSGQASAAGSLYFRIRKTFRADLSDSSFTVQYSIINKSAAAKSYAAWEIMRVPTGGLTFFPINGSVTGDLAPAFTVSGGIAWWDYDSTSGIFQKAFADGKDGWLAHADNNRLLHVKKFTDSESNFPLSGGKPLEKEIEFWADGGMYYNEIEKHSAYKNIPVGDSAVLIMKWYLRALPEEIDISEGSSSLLGEVQKILNSGGSLSPKVKETGSIRISPNPSNGWISLDGITSDTQAQIKLYNAIGQLVLTENIRGNDPVFLGSLKNGIYFYSVDVNRKRYAGKIILSR